MDVRAIRVGGFYVNEKKWLVREITSEAADGRVHWRSYSLPDGGSTGDSLMCSIDHIARWADREATPEEVAKLHQDKPDAKEMAALAMIEYVLTNIGDERLIAEFRRRGHEVVRTEAKGSVKARSAKVP